MRPFFFNYDRMGEMEIDVANIISAIGVIVAAYFSYNQYRRNKLTDLKVEMFKRDTERKSYKRSENSAKVFGELWRVLHETNADRVYIVQPHPLGHIAFLSVQFEVKRKGVEGMRMMIQKLEMSEVAVFSKEMADNLWMCFTDIDAQVSDRVAKSLLSSNGTSAVAIKRLNSSRDWVGSIFCEFIDPMEGSEEDVHRVMHEAAMNIQYILPEFVENKG